jgi:hypothetical protein
MHLCISGSLRSTTSLPGADDSYGGFPLLSAAPIIRFESCFGHITPIVTVGRAQLELNRRYGKPRRLPTKE